VADPAVPTQEELEEKYVILRKGKL